MPAYSIARLGIGATAQLRWKPAPEHRPPHRPGKAEQRRVKIPSVESTLSNEVSQVSEVRARFPPQNFHGDTGARNLSKVDQRQANRLQIAMNLAFDAITDLFEVFLL